MNKDITEKDIKQAENYIVRGIDIESSALLLEEAILNNNYPNNKYLQLAVSQILSFITESKLKNIGDKDILDYVRENVQLKEQLKQFDTEKCYVVTSLIENVYDGAKVKILGIKRTKREAWDIVTQKLVKYKQNYEKNDIDYEIESYEQSNILKSDYETITIEYHEIDK